MSEDAVTYVELQLNDSEKKDARHPAHKRREFPWHVIAIILGILCLFLLLATTVLGYMLLFKNKNVNDPGSDLPVQTGKDCEIHDGKLSCCGRSCYYFSKEEKTWEESKKKCQQLGYNLIKIDDKQEQKFIQSKINSSYWIGLHKAEANNSWLWLDGTSLSQQLNFQKTSISAATCGCLKKTNIVNTLCTDKLHYICGKKLICIYK